MLTIVQPSVVLSAGRNQRHRPHRDDHGTDSIVLPFVVPGGMPAGLVTVTLADLGWPGLMSSLSFAATRPRHRCWRSSKRREV